MGYEVQTLPSAMTTINERKTHLDGTVIGGGEPNVKGVVGTADDDRAAAPGDVPVGSDTAVEGDDRCTVGDLTSGDGGTTTDDRQALTVVAPRLDEAARLALDNGAGRGEGEEGEKGEELSEHGWDYKWG